MHFGEPSHLMSGAETVADSRHPIFLLNPSIPVSPLRLELNIRFELICVVGAGKRVLVQNPSNAEITTGQRAMGPVKGTIRRYYTPYEVAQHNTPDDCWVSFLGSVYDLTRLIRVGA